MGQSGVSAQLAVSWEIREGDCLDRLRDITASSVQCCVTSPPYFGLRDYGNDRQIGMEVTPNEYVARLVDVFREVRRVLRTDGTLWVNVGDSYAGKSLIGVPWRVALALAADGWILRSDVIWAKPNPMPESVTDRPTNAHEHVFLFVRSDDYRYNADPIREPHADTNASRLAALRRHGDGAAGEWVPGASHADDPHRHQLDHRGLAGVGTTFGRFNSAGRNARNVWEIAPEPFAGAHFAVFPAKLVDRCVLAGSAPGDVILDPFCGSGTTGIVALRRDRSFIGIELNLAYAEMARDRIRNDAPLFNVEIERVV